MARKIKTVYVVNAALCKKVERLARKGLSIRQIAVSLGWSEETIHKKKRCHPELAEAIKTGQTKNIKELVSSVHKRAKGYSFTETHVEEKQSGGKVTKLTKTMNKHSSPNVTAAIFLLTNLDPENWKHKSEQEISGGVNLSVGPISKKDVKKVNDLFDNLKE